MRNISRFMTLVVIGPVTKDLVIIGSESSKKVGGATYFQSFVFEEFFNDYLAIVNCSDEDLVSGFPDSDKVKVIRKDNSHYFVNEYPNPNDRDVRMQFSNFANIPIHPNDLEDVLPEDIDAFVVNPLNRHDFPLETIEFLKGFDVPIFMSIQGFLRAPDIKVNENYTIKLDNFNELSAILSGVDVIFLDEAEENIIGTDFDVDVLIPEYKELPCTEPLHWWQHPTGYYQRGGLNTNPVLYNRERRWLSGLAYTL